MERHIYFRLNPLFNIESVTPEHVTKVMKEEYFIDAVTDIANFFNDNLDELINDEAFFQSFYGFIRNLMKNIKNVDELYDLKNMTNWCSTVARKNMQRYTKYHEHKDAFYAQVKEYKDHLDTIEKEIDFIINNKTEKEDLLISKFLTLELRNIDYMFKVLETKPFLVNAKDKKGCSIFYHIIEYYISNVNDMSIEDIKYFKRLIVLFLESNELKIKEDEFKEIITMIEKNSNNKDVKFIMSEIDNRFELKNGFARKNCVDILLEDASKKIILPEVDIESRLKSSNLFTITLDGIKNPNHKLFLYDDAFSLSRDQAGNYYLAMHVPDVNAYVEIDSDVDKYMRSIGESVYIKDYKKPLLDYEMGSKMSLDHGKIHPTLSFIIKYDQEGNLLDIDFKKSYVNVNYNLSFAKADTFIESTKDKGLQSSLRQMNRLADMLMDKYHLKYETRSKANKITYVFNMIFDIEIAKYFNSRGIVFPYKIYMGKQYEAEFSEVKLAENYSDDHNLSSDGRDILFGIIDSKNRVYYDTTPTPNKNAGGNITGSVGNPLRDYISIESGRLINDLLIEKKDNYDFWEERIERDCIDITETSAKIRSLYSRDK